MRQPRVGTVRVVESLGSAPAFVAAPDEPPELLDRSGRVRVGPALRHFRARAGAPVVLITHRDLAHPLFRSLLGYSDRRHGTAIVSTWRLGGDDRVEARLANLIAHERGHLRGLRHCRTPGCVMHPARAPAELDARGAHTCGRCPSSSAAPTLLAAAVLMVLLFSGLDRIGSWASPAHAPPFSWRSSAAATTLLFNGRSVIRLQGRLPEAETRVAAERLNRAFLQLRPASPVAVRTGLRRAAIEWQGRRLIEFSEAQAGGASAFASAQGWGRQLDRLLRGKGTREDSCPACHVDRMGEVVETAERSRGR